MLYNKEELKTKVYSAHFEKETHNLNPGFIETTKKELKVACLNGYILITELQLPGKRKMDISSLLNGYSFDENAKLT